MKAFIKSVINGTPVEAPARRLQAFLTRMQPRTVNAEVRRRYDLETFEIMRRVLRSDSNCIDIGCHAGEILTQIVFMAPNGTHFAFEPLPGMYDRLLKKFGSVANVHFSKLALSDKVETTTFQHVVNNPGYSGFRRRRYELPHEQVREIVVQTTLLDNVVPETLPIGFIKVDVEGAELQVFRGAVKTILRTRPMIVFEHGLGAADWYGTTPDDVYGLLCCECNLKLHTLSDWLKSDRTAPLSQIEFCEQFHSGANYYFLAHP